MRILITGGNGLVGNAIKKIINIDQDNVYIFTNSKEANLTNYNDCVMLFEKYKPDKVVHLAADVGGLYKNINQKVSILENNVLINLNVLKCCHQYGIKRFIGCLSTCIFPDNIKYPITEKQLHDGPPHWSNDSYAYAKRLLEIQCSAYRQQYGAKYMCIIPTNIYGPHDNFNLDNSHVIPALIHKCYLAKKNNSKFIIEGSGKPLRQFIFSIDLAKLIILILNDDAINESIILSPDSSSEISISDIASIIANKFNYNNNIYYNTINSDGQFKKTVENEKLNCFFNDFKFTDIQNGLNQTIDWFIQNYDTCRK